MKVQEKVLQTIECPKCNSKEAILIEETDEDNCYMAFFIRCPDCGEVETY